MPGLAAQVPLSAGDRPPLPARQQSIVDLLPTLLIVTGIAVVVMVIMGRVKSREARLPSLEERLARLAPGARPQAPAAADTRHHGGQPSRVQGAHHGGHPVGGPAGHGGRETLDTVLEDAEELAQRLAASLDARAERLESLIREADDRLRRLEAAGRRMESDVVMVEPRGGPAPAATPAPRPAVGSLDAEGHDPLQAQVFALADQGHAPVEIARRIGQPTGQVELMLALRGR